MANRNHTTKIEVNAIGSGLISIRPLMPGLSKQQLRIARLYAAIDDDGQIALLEIVEEVAKHRPRSATAAPRTADDEPAKEKFELSAEEQQLITDFRRMGRASRTLLPKFANKLAADDVQKAHKKAPSFQLIQGGAA